MAVTQLSYKAGLLQPKPPQELVDGAIAIFQEILIDGLTHRKISAVVDQRSASVQINNYGDDHYLAIYVSQYGASIRLMKGKHEISIDDDTELFHSAWRWKLLKIWNENKRITFKQSSFFKDFFKEIREELKESD